MTYKREAMPREDRRTVAAMLGLPERYAARAARVLELWEPQTTGPRVKVNCARGAWAILRPMIGAARKEKLVGLYLDAQNGVVACEVISVGGLNTTRTSPREIFYPAISNLALGLILAHNHPSGSLDASDEDVSFTRAVHRAGETLGIELYDHLIVTREGFTSLRERGAF